MGGLTPQPYLVSPPHPGTPLSWPDPDGPAPEEPEQQERWGTPKLGLLGGGGYTMMLGCWESPMPWVDCRFWGGSPCHGGPWVLTLRPPQAGTGGARASCGGCRWVMGGSKADSPPSPPETLGMGTLPRTHPQTPFPLFPRHPGRAHWRPPTTPWSSTASRAPPTPRPSASHGGPAGPPLASGSKCCWGGGRGGLRPCRCHRGS